MTDPRILIAGIGNAFLGDDGFGVEVVQRLSQRSLPQNVCVIDFGIRVLDLMHALLHGYDAAILVETVRRGCEPGSVFVLEPPRAMPSGRTTPAVAGRMLIDGHGIDPMRVLRLVNALGGSLRHIYIVGCEPGPLAGDAVERQITPAVRRAIVDAIPMIESLVAKISRGGEAIPDFSPTLPFIPKGDSNHASPTHPA